MTGVILHFDCELKILIHLYGLRQDVKNFDVTWPVVPGNGQRRTEADREECHQPQNGPSDTAPPLIMCDLRMAGLPLLELAKLQQRINQRAQNVSDQPG